VFLVAALTAFVASAADAQAAPAPPPLRLDLSDHGAFLARPIPQASAAETIVEPKTAVDHQFAPSGLVGQAGYLCGIGGIGPDGDALRGGPASAHGHSGTFLGASLGYAFR
jgi:hypothetical protein